jgi:Stress responsive A/B Barrel Domain
MIRHIVLLNWKENTERSAIDKVTEAFASLPSRIPEIRSYQFGPDLEIYEGNADYVLVADFDNEEDFKTYVVHPDHGRLMKEVSLPITQSYQSAQFSL